MQALLTLQHGDGHPRHTRLVESDPVRIGRHRKNDVVALDKFVSREHALMRFNEGQWELQGFETRNPTHLNGTPLTPLQWVSLSQGDLIRIGSTIWRFQTEDDDAVSPPTPPEEIPVPEEEEPDGETPQTIPFAFTELSSLFHFVEELPHIESPQTLVEVALKTVYQLTNPTWVGFLGLDEEHPLPRLVYPEEMQVDVELSRQLTRWHNEKQRPVWLWEDGLHGASDSLLSYTDAMCVPVATEEEAPFGALHVYRVGKSFIPRSLELCKSVARSLARRLAQLRQQRVLQADNSRIQERGAHHTDDLVGHSAAICKLRETIERAGRANNVRVLIQGETGAGKELVALGVHRQSERAREPFVPVNCGAISETLALSDFFGHCKGAFSGADSTHLGYFQQADQGTLFLDEIGELPLGLQVILLRVLDNGKIPMVGAEKEPECDVRVIAATNRDLALEVEEGRFREDLYFRLREFPIRVPPLRDHLEDLPELAGHFLQIITREFKRKQAPVLDEKALELLQQQPWKGNVRELRAVLSCAVAMSDPDEDVLTPSSFSLPDAPKSPSGPSSFPETVNWEALRKWALLQALDETEGNQKAAAQLLGASEDTVAKAMDKYGVPRPKKRK